MVDLQLPLGSGADLSGQWTGRFSGTNDGLIVLDLDKQGRSLRGSANTFPDDRGMPGTFVPLDDIPLSLAFQRVVQTEPFTRDGVRTSTELFNRASTQFVAPFQANVSSRVVNGS